AKPFRIIRPVFEFIGVEPGYDELDVSVCFLFFFSIFFAMLVGDAGYGCLFLASAIFAKMKFRNEAKLKLPLNLFIVLSISTIIWGALGGSWFSIPSDKLPVPMRGIDALTNPETKDGLIQTICFILAGLHLSLARIWRGVLLGSWKSLGQFGWAMVIWANFFVIKGLLVDGGKLPTSLLAIVYPLAFLLLLAFYVDWKNLGDIFNFPFAVIGSFTDVLSYIRLYAVGLAGYYLALNTNQIGAMLFTGPLMSVAGVIVIFLGHSLNIVLCFLGVLVHGIRLNTLEFSNHMELQWKGFKYNPLKIETNNNIK
nr:hypothetical protein [Victivallales bacterium]